MTKNSKTVISPQIIDHRDFSFFSALIIVGNLFPLPHLLKFFRDNNFLKLRKLTCAHITQRWRYLVKGKNQQSLYPLIALFHIWTGGSSGHLSKEKSAPKIERIFIPSGILPNTVLKSEVDITSYS